MLIKKIPKAGHFAWSNSKKNNYLFATGTLRTAQDILLNTDQENLLQIYSLDTGDKSEHLNCLGKTKCESAFNCLAWDTFDEENQYPYGILVGGLQDGSLTIWDPNDIITYWKKHNSSNSSTIETNIGCLCYEQSLFSTAVQAIEFNPFKPNLIATGGSSEVLIMNVERNISSPEIFSPGTPNLHQGSTISSVSWNKKVQHILASASLNGLTVVWDLKTNKPIFNFQDSSITYNRNISLSWNPEIPTQIAVSYDDEKNCELQIWDLRNPQGPVMLFGQGHNKGINCVNWCTNDPSLILTGGRDDKIVCWNYKTGEKVSEMITGENVCNVKWSPKLPSIFSVTSESGNVTINTLSSEEITDYAPKWYKTPICARFGRNNKISVFNEDKLSIISEFKVQKSNDEISQKLTNFERVYSDAEKTNDFSKICDVKLNSTTLSAQSKLHWSYIKALSNSDKTTFASTVIDVLGFSKNDIIKQAENYTGKTHRKKDEGSPNQATSTNNKIQKNNNNYDFTLMSKTDAEGFFEQLSQVSTQKLDQKPKLPNSGEIRKDSVNLDQEILALDTISKNVNWDASIEKIIKQNILIGNYEGAIDCALKCGRNGEALLLAYSHSASLFEATANAFFVASKDTFIKNVFKNIVEKQNKDIAKGYNLDAWKEVAVLSITSKKPEEFVDIMNILGQRLIDEKKDDDSALLCFLLSRNIEKLIEIFKKKIDLLPPNSNVRKLSVINYTEKLVVLLQILNVAVRNNQNFDHLLEEFAITALEYDLNILGYQVLQFGSEKSFKIQEMKDYIYHSNEEVANHFKTPIFPFKFENVSVRIQSKTDPKKKNIESKPIFSPSNQQETPNKGKNVGRPDLFVPTNTHPTNKGEMGPPVKSSQPPPITSVNSAPFNPVKNQTNATPPINPSLGNTVTKFTPPPPVHGFVNQNKQQEIKNEIPPPNPAQNKGKADFHPPNFNPPIPPVKHVQEIKPNPVSNFPLPPPPKPISEIQKTADYNNNNNNINNNSNQTFDPNANKFPSQTPIPKSFPIKNPPPRPGPLGGQPLYKPTVSEQPLIKEEPKQAEDRKKFEEKKLSEPPKKTDFNNLSNNSQQMIDSLNKAKNILSVIEPNMRRKMELEKTLDQLKDMISNDSLKPETYSSLFSLLQFWENGNSNEAINFQTKICKEDWDQNKDWLKTIKRVLLRK